MAELNVESKVDLSEFNAHVSINTADLSSAMAEQAALAAHYGRLLAEAAYQTSVFKIRRNAVEANVIREMRENYEKAGTKMSETRLNTEVLIDTRYVKAQRDYAKAQYEEELAKNAFEAIRQRRDMLIQMGLSDREDRKGELWMRAKENEAQEFNNRAEQAGFGPRN